MVVAIRQNSLAVASAPPPKLHRRHSFPLLPTSNGLEAWERGGTHDRNLGDDREPDCDRSARKTVRLSAFTHGQRKWFRRCSGGRQTGPFEDLPQRVQGAGSCLAAPSRGSVMPKLRNQGEARRLSIGLCCHIAAWRRLNRLVFATDRWLPRADHFAAFRSKPL